MPTQQTDTIRVLPVGQPYNRAATADKDQKFVNCFVETVTNPFSQTKKQWLIKRPGFGEYNTIVNPPPACNDILDTTNYSVDACGNAYWVGNDAETTGTAIQLFDNLFNNGGWSTVYSELVVNMEFDSMPVDEQFQWSCDSHDSGNYSALEDLPAGTTTHSVTISIDSPSATNSLGLYLWCTNSTSATWRVVSVCATV